MQSKLVVALVPFVLAGLLAGCASTPAPDQNAEKIHCYRSKLEHYRKGPCTSAPVPSLAADAAAKAFQPDPAYFTVYVVRQSWGDGSHRIPIEPDGRTAIETLPDTLVRLRLQPGAHELAFSFEGQRHSTRVEGRAGELAFVRLGGTAWAWSSHYEWVDEAQADIRARVRKTRLVADRILP